MTSIIKFQAFSGVEGESPPCYLLQVDEFRFLLDCGWDEDFNMQFVENIKRHLSQIDAVLLSYPDPLHLGALPYLVGKCGLDCPIYATSPVYKMGQMFMYDLYQSRHNSQDFSVFTLDDVDAAFDKVLQLKYSQTVSLKGKGHGLQITPLPAGHIIGGTTWKIVKDGEEEIIYMVDYNHKKERHLNGCQLEALSRPHLLITDAFNALYSQSRRRNRDEQLMTLIVQTLRNDGNVLISVDTAGRVLELAQLLDQMWRTAESGLMAYSLALLSNVTYNVVEFAKSQVEWMSDKILRTVEDQRTNPFQFKYIQTCHNLAELSKVPSPKVVLASTPDMQCGFSRDIFVQWCSNPKNTIILTTRTSPGTLARSLIDNPQQRSISLQVWHRVKLEGAELEEYINKEKEREAEEARKKAEQNQGEDDSSEESDLEEGGKAELNAAAKGKHDLMLKTDSEKGRVGFFKHNKKSHPMYPFSEEKLKWDDYGELIRPEDFVILEPGAADGQHPNAVKSEATGLTETGEVPTKCVCTQETMHISANVVYIDFEGRSDGESIRKIITQIKPRQLVLVRGTKESVENLAEYCRNARDAVQGIFIPRLNEVLDATIERNIYQVKLKDSLVSALKFARARDVDIAWMDAVLDMTTSRTDTSAKHEINGFGNKPDDEEMRDVAEQDDVVPILLPIPSQLCQPHVAVFVNEPKLSDFKQVLMKEGIQAEFSGGVLICNGVVAVRRNDAGRLQLEGCLSDDYFRVRKLLYSQFAIV